MTDRPLEVLGDLALAWLGDAAMRRGPADPHARAPRLIEWLADECCAEQARRRGEGVAAPATLSLLDFSAAELVAAGEFAALWTIASRQVGVEAGTAGRDAGAEAAKELVAFGELLSEAIAATLAVTAQQPVTH